MCIPLAALAVVAVGATVAGTAVNAYGQAKSASAAKKNANAEAEQLRQQALISNFNAEQDIAYGEMNAAQVLAIAGINNKLNANIADLNVEIAGVTSDFNLRIAEGNASLHEAQGEGVAAIHRTNARAAEQDARLTLERGNAQEQQSRAQYSQLKGRQRAALAASGVALDEGSALRVQTDTEYANEADAATIRSTAIREAWGHRVDWANETAAASMSSLNGKARAMSERGEAIARKLAADVQIANTKMTSSFQILQTEMDAAIESQNIMAEARSSSWNNKTQALGFSARSAMAKTTAKSISPLLAAGGTLLTGAGQVASMGYGFKRDGVF